MVFLELTKRDTKKLAKRRGVSRWAIDVQFLFLDIMELFITIVPPVVASFLMLMEQDLVSKHFFVAFVFVFVPMLLLVFAFQVIKIKLVNRLRGRRLLYLALGRASDKFIFSMFMTAMCMLVAKAAIKLFESGLITNY